MGEHARLGTIEPRRTDRRRRGLAEIVLDALGQPVHVFGGLRDFRTPLVVRQGEVQTAGPITDAIRALRRRLAAAATAGSFPRPPFRSAG